MNLPNEARPITNAINNIEDAKKIYELLLDYSKKHAIQHPTHLPLAGLITSGLSYKDGCLAFCYKPGLPPKCAGHDTYNGCMYKAVD